MAEDPGGPKRKAKRDLTALKSGDSARRSDGQCSPARVPEDSGLDPTAGPQWPRREDIKLFKRTLGALLLDGVEIAGVRKVFQSPPATTSLQGWRLFHSQTRGEISEVVRKFEELGLADLLEPPEWDGRDRLGWPGKLFRKEGESADRICATLGVEFASIEHLRPRGLAHWRQAHKGEADAWFLINFARFYRQQNAAQTEIADRLQNANALGSLMLWRRYWNQGIDLHAVEQAAFRQGRAKKDGPKAGKEKRTLRRKVISEIVNEFNEIPRHGSGNVHWGNLAKAVRKKAGEKALSDQGKAFTEAQRRRIGSFNEVARQGDRIIIIQIKAGMDKGEIRKLK